MALALVASSALFVGCKNKPRCPRGEQALVGALSPAASALSEASVCNVYGMDSPRAQAVIWGERDELLRLKMKVRLAMRVQGWDDFDPSSAYYRASEDELNFRQGNQRMKYTFRLATWRGLVNHTAPAINVDVSAWTDRPRGYR